jgi:hypothetical protein
MFVNKILKTIALPVLFVFVTGCSDMNDSHDMYLKNGEISYIGRLDSAKVFAGKERFLLRYWVSDPRAKVLKVYWLQKQDSIIAEIPAHTPQDSLEILIGGSQKTVPEGGYTLQIHTFDGTETRSVVYEKNVNTYGEKFQSTLLNRLISNTDYHPSTQKLTISWAPAISVKEVGIEIDYYNFSGDKIILRKSTDEMESGTVLNNVDPTKEVHYSTLYLPEPDAIDTFTVNPQTVSFKINVARNCQTETSDFLAPYTGGMAVDGNTVDAVSRWVSDDSNNEHWLIIDLGKEQLISSFETWSGSPAQAQFKLQIETDGVWTDIHTVTNNTNLYYSASFTPVKTRKVRYYIPAYQTNRVRLFEIAIYSE